MKSEITIIYLGCGTEEILSTYENDLLKSGAKILFSSHDEESFIASITISVSNSIEFLKKYSLKGSYHKSSLGNLPYPVLRPEASYKLHLEARNTSTPLAQVVANKLEIIDLNNH